MRYFFKTTRFKVILGVAGGLLVIMIIVKAIGGWGAPQSGIVGAIVTPIQKFAGTVADGVRDIFSVYGKTERLESEKEELREQLREANSKLVGYEEAIQENELLRSFYHLQEEHPDFKMKPARLITYDAQDAFGAFTIDKGSLAGVAPGDPVVTPDGLVGSIHQVSPTFSTVITILSPDRGISALDSRTSDQGSVSGNLALFEKGLTRLSYLSRTNSVAVDDFIVTSGVGGMFPKGLIIGTVVEIKQETASIDKYATIRPSVRFDELSAVMVITSFDGQE